MEHKICYNLSHGVSAFIFFNFLLAKIIKKNYIFMNKLPLTFYFFLLLKFLQLTTILQIRSTFNMRSCSFKPNVMNKNYRLWKKNSQIQFTHKVIMLIKESLNSISIATFRGYLLLFSFHKLHFMFHCIFPWNFVIH